MENHRGFFFIAGRKLLIIEDCLNSREITSLESEKQKKLYQRITELSKRIELNKSEGGRILHTKLINNLRQIVIPKVILEIF